MLPRWNRGITFAPVIGHSIPLRGRQVLRSASERSIE